jgi:UDP-GlcNAc3NAcA epimerase
MTRGEKSNLSGPSVLSVVGARPQFIKASLVSRALRNRGIAEILLHTGQHYDPAMSEIFFTDLNLPKPDYHLGVGSGPHGAQTGQMLRGIEEVLVKEQPLLVVVYGDTNTTLAGALAASKLRVPVAHVEAGLRSYNKGMPEEINRVLTDHVSSLLFCPTIRAVSNLQREGFPLPLYGGALIPTGETTGSFRFPSPGPSVINVGDVMFDLASTVAATVNNGEVLSKYGLVEEDFVLVTVHRAENTDNREDLRAIMKGLAGLAGRGFTLLFPVHPRTRRVLDDMAIPLPDTTSRLRLVDPLPYAYMIALERSARVIITDSGGVQKEGYFFGTPSVVPRQETEWTELTETGWVVLTGPDKSRLESETLSLWNSDRPRERGAFYGDGNASERICRIITDWLQEGMAGAQG